MPAEPDAIAFVEGVELVIIAESELPEADRTVNLEAVSAAGSVAPLSFDMAEAFAEGMRVDTTATAGTLAGDERGS